MKIYTYTALACLLLFAHCKKNDIKNPPASTPSTPTGKIVYEAVVGGAIEYDLSTKANNTLMQDAFSPQYISGGDIFHIVGEKYLNYYYTTGKMGIANAAITSRSTVTDVFKAYYSNPQISPDRSMIAFNYMASSSDSFRVSSRFGVLVMGIDGKMKALFDSVGNPTWTSDGRLLADGNFKNWYFGSESAHVNDVPGIYIIDASLKTKTRISTPLNGANLSYPVMSNDGKLIAYISNRDLFIMNADGSNHIKLASENTMSFPCWSPDGKYICVTGSVSRAPLVGTQAALAVVSASLTAPVILNDNATNWLRNTAGEALNGWKRHSWK